MRVQVELVDSLEHRLTKERNRLQAMMQHLHMKQSPDTTTPALGKVRAELSGTLALFVFSSWLLLCKTPAEAAAASGLSN